MAPVRLSGLCIDVVRNNIRRECDYGDSKTREQVGEHCTIREDWVLAPGLPLGPGITE